MRLTAAQVLADKICVALEPLCDKVAIAGSIRRQKAEVNDIDIVALPKAVDLPGGLCGTVKVDPSIVWKNLFPKALVKLGLTVEASGQELIRCTFRDYYFQVDLYRARPETWGVILLVRTGSKEHNVKLCSLAKSKGLKLSACEGVVAQDGFGQVLASETEEEIFAALGLLYLEPREREVH